ncbi:hypothetical protein MTR_7g082960 [Medicago truncatula]|uniref:Transmembrane protein n=1 Tax=Medicago truncatula TaxID=3880 RepID=G7KVA3_MEDTR|nr:hypothetical protein MTR_7g082960 [Medicago truncatula]
MYRKTNQKWAICVWWFYGVVVSTLDFESSDLGSTPGRTSLIILVTIKNKKVGNLST